MKTVRYIFSFLVGLLVLIFVVALIIPQDYKVERSITIQQPDSTVFNYVKYLKNQDQFSVWSQMDPDMKQTFKGTDGTVGFVSAWESKMNEVGVGSQEIVSIADGKRVDFALHFKKPRESEDKAYFITEKLGGDATKVTWGISGKLAYPMNIMYLFYNMDKMIGPDLEQGLKNLKGILEKQ
jgi:hypothetical protein